jgi:hypothetical protein
MAAKIFMTARNKQQWLAPRYKRIAWLVCALPVLLLVDNFEVAAQDTTRTRRDTVIVESRDTLFLDHLDTVAIKSYAKRFSPRKAILYAAILPGLGQAYNKKYWKLPLVYGGFYAIGYYIDNFNDIYTEYKGYLFYNLENGRRGQNDENPFIKRTTGQLRTIVDKARRERDFMIILMGGMYLLQMVDAHVDAHLKEFDLNPKLQVRLEPSMDENHMAGRTMGVALVMKFK